VYKIQEHIPFISHTLASPQNGNTDRIGFTIPLM